MDAYVAAGGKWECTEPSGKTPRSVREGCPCGDLEVLVLDDMTAEPIEGAVVNVKGLGAQHTDVNGRAFWSKCPPGDYRVEVEEKDYTPNPATAAATVREGETTRTEVRLKPVTFTIRIGAHLDGPNDKIGHAFVSVEYPKGAWTTKGFWPKNGFDLGEKSDRKGVTFGMEGVIMDDSEYLKKPKSRIKSFSITEEQAKAALAKIAEYETEKPSYTLLTNQCAVFAVKVLEAAGQKISAGTPNRPTALYESIVP